MSPDQWRLVTEIFRGALVQGADARPVDLDAACNGDAVVRAEVEALLDAHLEALSVGAQTGTTTARQQLAPGTLLGPYRIDALIGVGGMGEVYKARDTRLDRTVAIKVLPADISADADRCARFEREAKSIAGLTHPHICTLHDVGEHAGSMFLVHGISRWRDARPPTRERSAANQRGRDHRHRDC